jgi:hypothetical protein
MEHGLLSTKLDRSSAEIKRMFNVEKVKCAELKRT